MVRSQKKRDCEASIIDCKYKNASTYVKLQEAYASESGAVGNWANIGYIAPGTKGTDAEHYSTTVFDYENKFSGANSGTTMVNALGSTFVDAWEAKAKTALNDCPINSIWHVKIAAAGTGATVKYQASIDGSSVECSSLTANFKNISHD